MKRAKQSNEFLENVQNYVAVTSVGASTVRGYPKKTAERSKEFFKEIYLGTLAGKDRAQYKSHLNVLTKRLMQKLPKASRHKQNKKAYGIARKVLNIFLHNAFYNRYLCEAYKLDSLEEYLEVPIDKKVAMAIKKRRPKRILPAWNGIKALDGRVHRQYQTQAMAVADKLKISVVHLDAYFYPNEQ